jgi:hypothetical protein
MTARLVIIVAGAALATATAFAATPIGDVVRNRDAYANQTVTIEGTVTEKSFAYKSDAVYDVRGSDDVSITVVGKGTAPAPGTKISVTGTVGRKPPDEEFDFPPVVLESSRVVQ